MAKVLIVNSSFRKNSNSSELGLRVAEGARNKGHEVTVIDISRLRIEPCRGCEGCHQPKSKGCVVKDDMQPLFPLVREADVIIYASPVYWFNLCGQIKQFIDRCYSVAVQPEHKEPSPFATKKLGLVMAYGDEDPFNSGCVNALRSVQDTCLFTGATWAGAVYGSATDPGEIKSNAALMEKAVKFGESL